MAGVHGTDYYGKTDQVRGMFHVSTLFWHFNFLPLFPTQSILFWEIPELQNQYQGVQLPLHWKSVVLGYLRGGIGALALFFCFFGAMSIADIALGGLKGQFWLAAVVSVAICFLVRHVLLSESWDYWPALGVLLFLSATGTAYCYLIAAQAGAMPQRMENNLLGVWGMDIGALALFLHGATYFWTPAGLDDALAYGAQLGLTDDAIRRRFMGLDPEPFPPLQTTDFRPGFLESAAANSQTGPPGGAH